MPRPCIFIRPCVRLVLVAAWLPWGAACLLGTDASLDEAALAGPVEAQDVGGDHGGGEDPDVSSTPGACGARAGGLPGERVGDPCGACGNGALLCGPDEVLGCVGDRTDACGACDGWDRAPDAPCGPCGGVWRCGDGAWRCEGDATNLCGGCAELVPQTAVPGFRCSAETFDGPGMWACDGWDRVVCRPAARNACGGEGALSALPGQPCGACSLGRWRCDGADALRCCFGAPGEACLDALPLSARNACGGCEPLRQPDAEEACGPCGTGRWQRDCARGIVFCAGPGLQACGGCGALPGPPGAACPGGVTQCVSTDEVRCVAGTPGNACGGQASLAGRPGDACGPCGDGVWVCAGADRVSCVGARSTQPCGGCRTSHHLEAASCFAGQRWRCDTPGEPRAAEPDPLACLLPADRGPCGQALPVQDTRGEACPCKGRWVCLPGEPLLACLRAPEDEPALRFRDRDGDGWGDRNDPGSSQCGREPGYADRSGDCDDTDPDVNPDRSESPGNGRDDDCDPATPD